MFSSLNSLVRSATNKATSSCQKSFRRLSNSRPDLQESATLSVGNMVIEQNRKGAERLDSQWTKGVPEYMKDIYTWAYVNPTNVRLLDHQIVVDAILFFNARVLEKCVMDNLPTGGHVLQVGHTHGNLCPDAATKVGSTGRFSVVDVTPIQVEQAKSKLQQYPWSTVRTGDASEFSSILPDGETPYDTVYAFMLLHEIPDKMKYQVVDNMLKSVKKGGTVVWVEYHGPPYWYNPTRYFMPFIFRWLEPFALRMWESEIDSFANAELKKQFTWSKETYGGNLYQVVIAKHNNS